MTSPRRSKKSGQCVLQHLDWDSPSTATGTVKRRRSSCPENSSKRNVTSDDGGFETQTTSDYGSGTSRTLSESDKSDSLIEVEERISCILNENRSSQSNSESGDVDIIIDSFLENPIDEELLARTNLLKPGRSNTFIRTPDTPLDKQQHSNQSTQKSKEKRLKTPIPIKKINKSLDIVRNTKSTNTKVLSDKSSVLPIYKSNVRDCDVDLSSNSQKRKNSKLKLPFSPAKSMEKPKAGFFQNKNISQEPKTPQLLSSPVRRTISNEYVRLKFTNDTVVRRTIDGRSIKKITPKIQSIIPESPIDNEDPFLNLSPNKKYTVTVNNRVRCDKDNYVIFDPSTGFKPDESPRQSRLSCKASEKFKVPPKSTVGEKSTVTPKPVSVSDTDSGILSPNSPGDTSERVNPYYVNAAVFSDTAKRYTSDLDIRILDPAVAKKATEQIKVSSNLRLT